MRFLNFCTTETHTRLFLSFFFTAVFIVIFSIIILIFEFIFFFTVYFASLMFLIIVINVILALLNPVRLGGAQCAPPPVRYSIITFFAQKLWCWKFVSFWQIIYEKTWPKFFLKIQIFLGLTRPNSHVIGPKFRQNFEIYDYINIIYHVFTFFL